VSVYIPFVELKPLLWSHFYCYLNGNWAKRHWRTGKELVASLTNTASSFRFP